MSFKATMETVCCKMAKTTNQMSCLKIMSLDSYQCENASEETSAKFSCKTFWANAVILKYQNVLKTKWLHGEMNTDFFKNFM